MKQTMLVKEVDISYRTRRGLALFSGSFILFLVFFGLILTYFGMIIFIEEDPSIVGPSPTNLFTVGLWFIFVIFLWPAVLWYFFLAPRIRQTRVTYEGIYVPVIPFGRWIHGDDNLLRWDEIRLKGLFQDESGKWRGFFAGPSIFRFLLKSDFFDDQADLVIQILCNKFQCSPKKVRKVLPF